MNYREEPDAHLLAKKRQYMKRTKKLKTFVIAFICFTIAAVWALIGWAIYKLSQDYAPEQTTAITTVANEETAAITETSALESGSFYDGVQTKTIEISKDQVYSGSLIIVTDDVDRAYRAKGADIVTLLGVKSRCYKIVDNSIKLERSAYIAAEEMFNAFYDETGNGNYHLRMAHFDAPSTKCVSEHLTGYAFDMNIYDGTPTALDAAGAPYDWIYENCAKYGYVLRYPGTDSDHFRFVGKGHSAYIHENGITLDEYVGLLQKHIYGKSHLSFSYDGVDYECFYVMLDVENENVEIAIPSDVQYTVSGDNVSGAIVLLYK